MPIRLHPGDELDTVGHVDEAVLGIGFPKLSIRDPSETLETVFGRIQAVWRQGRLYWNFRVTHRRRTVNKQNRGRSVTAHLEGMEGQMPL